MKISPFSVFALATMVAALLFFNPSPIYAQTFSPTGSMTTAREGQTATLLPNGTVLIAGGTSSPYLPGMSSAEVYNPVTSSFTATGKMTTGRLGHTATLLNNGLVLLAGGGSSTSTATAELYNPATGTFTATGSMKTPRFSHTATLLNNGTVLITGGFNNTSSTPVLSGAEIYNPSTGTFTSVGNLHTGRYAHAATLLPNGLVLVSGGLNSNGNYLSSAELYSPSTETFSITGSLKFARESHSATLLSTGLVLVVGGIGIVNTTTGVTGYVGTTEAYNPSTGTFTTGASLNTARSGHTATFLDDGELLIAGGLGSAGGLSSCELYNPTTGTFSVTGSMSTPRISQTATLLNGTVLMAGGYYTSYFGYTELSSAEVYSFPTGYVHAKYVVLSVQYAPPGSKSTVDYGTSTNVGTSTTLKNSFQNMTSDTVSVSDTIGGQKFNIFGISINLPSITITDSASTTNTVEQDTTSSVAFNNITTNDIVVPGPASNAAGVDHAFDKVEIWLNPVVVFTTPSASALDLTNYYYDTKDPCLCMDVVTLTVGELLNPSLITNQTQLNQLMRSWAETLADGSSPSLTSEDLAAIAQADPFSNPTYTPMFEVFADGTCSTDKRFCKSQNADVQYASPQQGGQGNSIKYGQTYTETATEGQGAIDTHQTGFSVDTKISGGFLGNFTTDTKVADTLTWTNQWSTQTSETTSQSVTTTIVPPGPSDGYTGPTEFDVYQDNVYGTLMFSPVNFPGFIISASPLSQTVVAGGQTTYKVSSTVVDGFSTNINLTASGLPANATATFNPATIAPSGSSTLTIGTTSAVAPGTYTININAAVTGALAHTQPVTLVIGAGPDFSISASPASQSVTVGANTTFSVSTTALNGFSGSIALTLVGLPAGATATFNPTSVSGTGSSTLSVTTSTTTPVGGYTLTITGTSGTLTHSAVVTLMVTAATPSFTLSANPDSEGIAAGTSATFTVSTTAVNGFTGTVQLTLAGLPTGASAIFTPASITGAGSSTLKITTSTSTPTGTSDLTIFGTSGSLQQAVLVTLTVNAP